MVGNKSIEEIREWSLEFGKVEKVKKSISYTHVFTHKKWKMQAYFVTLGKCKLSRICFIVFLRWKSALLYRQHLVHFYIS